MSAAVATVDVPSRRVRSRLAVTVYFTILGVLVLSAAELTARVQDWIRYGTSMTGTPGSDADLFVSTETGRRGKPNGHFKKWTLNEFGFRSGRIALTPSPGVTRIAVLGSSETFGLYESPDREFPAQLQTLLAAQGRYEVVNAAMTGLTLHSTIGYWHSWVSRFQPDVIVIYPSPLFYLNDAIASRPVVNDASPKPAPAARPVITRSELDVAEELLGKSRLLDHARDKWDVPDFIQRERDRRTIAAALNGHPQGWVFRDVPVDRVQLLVDDLADLVHAVQRSSANVMVLTHASSVLDPPRPEDMNDLAQARVHTPRATPDVIGRFMTSTNEAIRSWCRTNDVPLVDVAEVMNGHREMFGDLIHFNDAGAAAIAQMIGARFVAEAHPAVAERAGQTSSPASTHAVQ